MGFTGNGNGEGSSMPGADSSIPALGTEPIAPPVSSFGGLGGTPDVVSAVTADVNNPGSQVTGQEFTTPFTDPNQGATPGEASSPTFPIPTTELLQGSGNNPTTPTAAENTGLQQDQLSSATAEAAPTPEQTPEDILGKGIADLFKKYKESNK